MPGLDGSYVRHATLILLLKQSCFMLRMPARVEEIMNALVGEVYEAAFFDLGFLEGALQDVG